MLFKNLSLSTTFFGVAYCLCLTILERSWEPGSYFTHLYRWLININHKKPKKLKTFLLGRLSFEKKKSCEFSQLWSWPPPLKVVKTPIFFYSMTQKNIMCKLRKILPWKPKIVRKKSIFSWKLSKFSKYIGQGVPLPPSKKILLQIWMN